ncbi:hypothetical protein [Streptomyces natalensis]|uniref:Uncharacterized protein n=1 Tax=Streptomyces natalensis ATCC 27448 TaxID=1240678 RepID=A0A0D7CN78_9ACTN|nr:hypothetical protein [Streptomyces natalensis]KIZ16877.1 hypothetical protein SNA_18000 [Streptomyces natalensis ATCC 27448]
MTDNAALPSFLADYLEQRAVHRTDAVNVVLASFTDWEKALVHDAAVMGYVQGMRHPQGEPIAKDRQTIAHVIDACLAFPDLYPAISTAAEMTTAERRETVEYFVQGQQPDGTWEQASSTTTDPDFATARLAARRKWRPGYQFRIARRTTTVVVEAYNTPSSEQEQP